MSLIVVPSLQHRSADELDIRRVRRGRGFSYHTPDGGRVTDEATLARIRAIVIPPAWTDVRISDTDDSHLQAIGRDARGRLQYRYHPRWNEFRDRVKSIACPPSPHRSQPSADGSTSISLRPG
jgi:DNA topoisomerase-1